MFDHAQPQHISTITNRSFTSTCLNTKQRAEIFTGLPSGVSKYNLLETVHAIAPLLGISPALMAHLRLLVEYTREQDWLYPDPRPFVWLSVTETAGQLQRSRFQIYRNECKLVELGFICHRNSGDNRRYGRRDAQGKVQIAYGVDLRPLGAQWDELREKHLAHNAECEERWRLKNEISSRRREIRDLLVAAETDPSIDLATVRTTREFNARITPKTSMDTLRNMLADLRSWTKTITAWRLEEAGRQRVTLQNATREQDMQHATSQNATRRQRMQHATP